MPDLATLTIAVDANNAIRVVDQFGNAAERAAGKGVLLAESAKRVGFVAGGAMAAGLALTIKNTIEAERVQAQLEARLRSTAGAAGQSLAALNDQSAALQRLTAFGDEATGSVQALLLTFTKIQGDIFPRATATALDLATALRVQGKDAALQLGKALNDPVLGVTALSRAGVQFSESQRATIQSLVETNQLAKAQGLILAELETQVGGSAAAYRNTLGGALEAVRNSFGDLFEVSSPGMKDLVEDINLLADSLALLPTALEIVRNRFEAITRTQFGEFTAVVGGVLSRAGATDLGASLTARGATFATGGNVDSDYAALLALFREQQQANVAAQVARMQARGSGAGGGLLGAGGADLVTVTKEELDAIAEVTRQHYQDSAAAAAYREERKLAEEDRNFEIAVGLMKQRHEADTRLMREQAEAAKENAEAIRVFREQTQIALADFGRKFLTDGFKSLDRFWASFVELGRQAIPNVFAKSVMDELSDSAISGITAAIKGALGTAAGPIGAIVGITAGVAGQVFGGGPSHWERVIGAINDAAEAQREAAAAQRAAAEREAVDWHNDFLNFAGTETPIERTFRQIASARDDLAETALRNALGAGANLSRRDMNFANAGDWQSLITVLQGTQGHLNDAGRLLLDQLMQLEEAFHRNRDAAREAAEAQERETNARRAASLEQFGADLLLSGQSILSPVAQLAEARRQYDAITALARGGDLSAVDSLPQTARALLDASRAVFASGVGYQDVFRTVQDDLARIAAALRAAGVDVGGSSPPPPGGTIPDGVISVIGSDAYAQALESQLVVQQEGFGGLIAEVRGLREDVQRVETRLRDGILTIASPI